MSKNEEHTCCICGKRFKGYGNNPYPIKKEGKCCDECNKKVIEERLFMEKIDKIMDSW